MTAIPHHPRTLNGRPSALCLWLGLSVTLLACGSEPEPQTQPVAESVTSPATGVTFSVLPEGFEVARNDADGFELRSSSPERPGVMWVEAGEVSDFGIELDSFVWQDRESYAERPGGEYLGGNKLVSQLGDAYYSRGRFDGEGREEEVAVFALHPSVNRLLTLRYRYPAGEDSAQRLPELLELLGAIEAAAVEPEAPPEQ